MSIRSEEIITKTKLISFILIGLVIFGMCLILLQLILYNGKPENFGVIGDAVGGILNPIIAIAAALLTFLAFYIQKIANDDLKKQFTQQREDQHMDFLFNNYKDRIMIILNEVNNFHISFHGGSLIGGLNNITDKTLKKYNFIGIQAINLFLIEYFILKEKRRLEGQTELIKEDSFHAIFLHISNLITAYFNIHVAVQNCKLEESPKTELLEILQFTYFSKFNYFFEFMQTKYLQKNLKYQIDYLVKLYQVTKE